VSSESIRACDCLDVDGSKGSYSSERLVVDEEIES
jgi:hypothetical protein